MDSPTIHVTDIAAFLGCRAKWNWTSPLRGSMTSKEPNKHMWLGRVIHYALAAYYGATPPRTKDSLLGPYTAEVLRTLRVVKDQLGYVPEPLKEFAELGLKVLDHYALWAPHHDDFDVIMPEVPLKVEEDGWQFGGQTDGLIRDTTGDLWLLEFKTSSRIPPEPVVEMSWQGPAYIWAARRDPALASIGKIKGLLYTFLYKAPPTKPQVLMNGGLSRRSNLRSTREAYLEEVRAHGLDPDDYAAYVSVLPKDLFFRRYLIAPSDEHLMLFEERLRTIVHEMTHNPAIYPQEGLRACAGCEFLSLCKAYFSGQAYEDLLDEFTISDYYQEGDRETDD